MSNWTATKQMSILDKDDMSVIYDCLNGKSHSCIHNGKIPTDKIQCALRKVFNNNPEKLSEKIIKLHSSEKEESPIDIWQEYYIRENIISSLEKYFDIKLPFEKSNTFHTWSTVKIREDSKYSHQSKKIGELQNDYDFDDEEDHQDVIFEDGYKNSYRRKDLYLIHNGKIVDPDWIIPEGIKTESRKDFLKRITQIIGEEINKDARLLNIVFPKDSFSIGENIVMNEKADESYNITTSGSIGVVMEKIAKHTYLVKYSKTGSSSKPQWEREVHWSTMTSLDEKPEGHKQSDAEIYKAVEAIVQITNTNIEHKQKQKELSWYEDSAREEFYKLWKKELINNNIFLPSEKEEDEYVLNFWNITEFVAPELYNLYMNPELYSSWVTVWPPAEKLPNVLKLELTDGCNHGKCTYCDRYHGVKHSKKPLEKFIEHTDKVVEALWSYKEEISRVFLGAGNGLEVDQETLTKALQHVHKKLSPKRVAIYGNTKAILAKSIPELRELKRNWLECIYRWIESGSDEVLQYVRKWCTFDQMVEAGEKANEANIDLSVMIMPGLWGSRLSQSHIEETIKLLNTIDVKYITFMAINPTEKSLYKRTMEKEAAQGTNGTMTDLEIVQQVKEIVKWLTPVGQKIWMYGKEIDLVWANPIAFRATFDREGRKEIIKKCEKYIRKNS
jgi:radical SAM superfamily enzyme